MSVSDAQFKEMVRLSVSYAEVCRRLEIRPTGGNYKTVKARIKKLNLDISHFTGQGWNKGGRWTEEMRKRKEIKLKDILVEDSTYTSSNALKKRLYKASLKEKKCEECGIVNWNKKELSFELEHVNGNNTDNRLENLKILCPNCHSQTLTYRGKNKKLSALSERRDVEFRKFRETLTDKADGNPEPSLVFRINKKNEKGAETRHGKSKFRILKSSPPEMG